MKRILIIAIAALALLGAPAMAAVVDVKLAVDKYVTMTDVPASVTVTLTGGATQSGDVRIASTTALIYCNTPVTVTAAIAGKSGAKGTWLCSMWNPAATPPAQTARLATATAVYPAGQAMDPGIFVQVSGVSNMAQQSATTDATLTVTVVVN
jgi:hypothetical protein